MYMDLDIDKELYRRLEQRALTKGFDSPEEYGVVVLRTVLDELEEKEETDEALEQRLQDLGYLE